jgi:hypothetical protein
MGFTGYRFKIDSATEKFIFQNFSVQNCGRRNANKRKPAEDGLPPAIG